MGGLFNPTELVSVTKRTIQAIRRIGYIVIGILLLIFLILFILSYVFSWPTFSQALFSGLSVSFGSGLLVAIITAYYQNVDDSGPYKILREEMDDGLLNRIKETINTIRSKVLDNQDAKLSDAQKSNLVVRYTAIIPTAHIVLVADDCQARVWYTPYLPGVNSRTSYRYEYKIEGGPEKFFITSIDAALKKSRPVFE